MNKYSDAITPEWEHKAWTNLYDLITPIPRELMKKLYLKKVRDLRDNVIGLERGGVDDNNSMRDLYVQAMTSCEKGREQMAELRKILNNTEENINRDMADLRNNYPTPYDSEDFVKAWRYANRNRKRLARFFEVNPSSVEEGKKAYEKFCGLFYGYFHDVPCHIKNFIQAENQRYGEIEFYVDGIVGDFHLYLPQNHMLEYATQPVDSMEMFVEYSAPDCAGFTTGTYRKICSGYDFDTIATGFEYVIFNKKGLGSECPIRTMDYYLEQAAKHKPEIDEMAKTGGKTYEEYVEYMKNAIMKATKGKVMSYDESDTMLFVFGLGFGAIFGGLLSAMMCFWALTGNAENEYKQLLQDAGIQLERHYTETDGVRTNWVDVIFINKEEKE